MSKDNITNNSEYSGFNNLSRIFKKRKWFFLGAFLFIFISGIIFNFLIASDYQYKASSVITLPAENIPLQRKISNEYPKEANLLWLFKDGLSTNAFYNIYLKTIVLEISSEQFLNIVRDNLDLDISQRQLRRLLSIEYRMNEHFFILSTFYNNPEIAEKLNNAIISEYINYKNLEFKAIYAGLIKEIEKDISIIEGNLLRLSEVAEQYTIDFNKRLIEDLSIDESLNIEIELSDYLSPEIENQINIAIEKYNLLNDIHKHLKDNEEFYTDSIRIISGSGVIVEKNFTSFRNFLLSIIAAIIFSLIFMYIVDFVISKVIKKNKTE